MSAALAVVLAAALVLGGRAGPVALLLVVATAQLLLAGSWLTAAGAPASGAGRLLVAVTGVAADLVVLGGEPARPMADVPAVVALAVLGVVLQQLLRRDGRAALRLALTATATAVVLVGIGAAWLAVPSGGGGALLVVAAAAVALAPAADEVARRVAGARRVSAVAAGWAGGWAGGCLTLVVALVLAGRFAAGAAAALPIAAAAAVVARLGVLLADRMTRRHPVLPAVLPMLLVPVPAYVLGRLLLG